MVDELNRIHNYIMKKNCLITKREREVWRDIRKTDVTTNEYRLFKANKFWLK